MGRTSRPSGLRAAVGSCLGTRYGEGRFGILRFRRSGICALRSAELRQLPLRTTQNLYAAQRSCTLLLLPHCHACYCAHHLRSPFSSVLGDQVCARWFFRGRFMDMHVRHATVLLRYSAVHNRMDVFSVYSKQACISSCLEGSGWLFRAGISAGW
jgi:hypothetical protein